MRRALGECSAAGIQTNLALLRRVFGDADLAQGTYTTEFGRRPLSDARLEEHVPRDLAAIVAVAHVLRAAAQRPSLPERLVSGWHQASRRLPNS
jgi:acetyl/propionyl-CoA carboxylase alpha subunit